VRPSRTLEGPSPETKLTTLPLSPASTIVLEAPSRPTTRIAFPRKSRFSRYVPGRTSSVSPSRVLPREIAYWTLA
jgi:hypothetical protein